MKVERIAIFGASSAIGFETARLLAERGAKLFLVARNKEKLDAAAGDLRARGAKEVACATADLADTAGHQRLFDEASSKLGGLDCIIVAHGTLGNQKECEADFGKTEQEIRTNFLSPLSLTHIAANIFEKQGSGSICVISSVAGDRGRQSNYIYGASKGALSLALQGVRNRLTPKGVQVLTVKPGFVDTPMTKDFPKGPLFVGPKKIAEGIVRAIDRGSDVVYLPWFWLFIMMIIKSIPETIFKRLKL